VHVQEALEKTFGVSLDQVRVHTGSDAHTATKFLRARAIAYGNDIYIAASESPEDLTLMGHEVAHVVQQDREIAVQRATTRAGDRYEREADRAGSAAARGDTFAVHEHASTPMIAGGLVQDALDWLADKAGDIPGYDMLCFALGFNPINGADVERTGANFLRAAVGLIPLGHELAKALDKYGVFEKAGAWLDKKLEELGDIGGAFKKAFWDFIDSLGVTDLFHPGRVWDRVLDLFGRPVNMLLDFIESLIEDLIQFVRDVILMPLAKLAEGSRGWDLLCAVLGKNPITGKEVPSGPDELIGGFMKLIGKEEIWENIKRANAISRAVKWFKNAMSSLWDLVTSLPGRFIDAFKSIELKDLLDIGGIFAKVFGVFGTFAKDFFDWALTTVFDLLEIIFEVVAPGAVPYVKKVGAAFKDIIEHPIRFIGNLVKAGKAGFHLFADNFFVHLKRGLIDWLTGSMKGVYLPKSFDLGEIVKFILSVLSISWGNLRQKLVKAVGEKAVLALETGFDIVVTLVHDGPGAAWDKIQEHLAAIKDAVYNGIVEYVTVSIVKAAIAKIVSFLVPGAGFISAIVSIYDTIMFLVHKLSKIIEVVTGFLDSMIEIVTGQIGGAAKKIETTLAGMLVLAINFLAGFLHVDDIAEKINGIIDKVRNTIDKALDKLVEWIVNAAKNLLAKLGGKDKGKDGDAKDDDDVRIAAKKSIASKLGEEATEANVRSTIPEVLNELRPRGLASLTLEPAPDDEDGAMLIMAEASPKLQLFKVEAKNIVPKGRSEVMEILLKTTLPTAGEPLRKVAPVDLSAATFIRPQSNAPDIHKTSAGGAVLPSAAGEVKMVTWNTSNQSLRRSTTGHAEAQFYAWLDGPGSQYLGNITDLTITLNPYSPCSTCTDLLASAIGKIKGRGGLAAGGSASIKWQKWYPGAFPDFVTKTTNAGLATLANDYVLSGEYPDEGERRVVLEEERRSGRSV
jgi:hypothetical protein